MSDRALGLEAAALVLPMLLLKAGAWPAGSVGRGLELGPARMSLVPVRHSEKREPY